MNIRVEPPTGKRNVAPVYAGDNTSWPALLAFANEVAMAYRVRNQELREAYSALEARYERLKRLFDTNTAVSR
jgi:hypothetical protein